VGCLPNLKPGLADAETAGLSAAQMPAALSSGDLSAIVLFQADPLRTHPDRAAWEAGLEHANFVVGFSDFVTESLTEHANVVFPAESYAEKDGTVTHPDGRVQRVRQAIGRPGEVRAQTQVLLELISGLLGSTISLSGPEIFRQVASAVPFYGGLTYEEIGGRGIRWQDRDAASKLDATPLPPTDLESAPELPSEGLRLGTAPSLWASRETDHAPVLRFLAPSQRAELSSADAQRLGIAPGDEVEVAVNGTSVRAVAALRESIAPGSVFLIEGTSEDNVNALTNGAPRSVEVRKS
jgi:NADH-quinone oxidoreductase subunit G